MELRHLRYFMAVAETGSLTAAAERRLHTSQPSLSRQIRELEDQVGVELLSRGARGVCATSPKDSNEVAWIWHSCVPIRISDLTYQVVGQEPLVVLMPSDHPLTTFDAIHPQQLVGQPFIAMVNKAKVARGVIDDYLKRSGVEITPTQGADNPAMVMSLVASMRGMALIPAYVENLMPWSVVSRPLAGDVPTIDLAVGYRKTNNSPVLKLFLARLDELIARVSTQAQLIARKSQEPN
jgi:DNA-binding transcriptional LysR family regulator